MARRWWTSSQRCVEKRLLQIAMMSIRPIEIRDERRWRELWDGYTRFYEREPVELITQHLWERIHDTGSPVWAIVAEDHAEVVGIAHYVIHDSTSRLAPVCYLQDLFVDPQRRGVGAGRKLIDWLLEEMKKHGWSLLYWNTKENNNRARQLYDTYTQHSGFVKYVIQNATESYGTGSKKKGR
jgi:GNAT superfamily N-acetyltransferase